MPKMLARKFSSDGDSRWPGAVPRQKRDALSRAACRCTYGPDGSPNGVVTRHFLAIGDLGHVVQTAAADDSYLDLFHECFFLETGSTSA